MLIDWFTIGAQALNFLILVWLLKRFLYKPILHAIEARENRITAELADADKKKTEAQREYEEFQHKNKELDQQRSALLSKATEEANIERQRLLDEVRKEVEGLREKLQEQLRSDAHHLRQTISLRTQQEVFSISRKALRDLSTASLEERMVEVFVRHLHMMESKTKENFAEALKRSSEPAVVRSAFALPAEQCTMIQNTLNEIFSAQVPIRFVTTPELVCGIELSTQGQKVAWSIADYLVALEKSLGELLKEKGEAKI